MSDENKVINVGFVGNPNCGKTTLFNAFTGAKPPIPLRRRSQGSVLRMEKSTSSSMWWMPPRWSGIST